MGVRKDLTRGPQRRVGTGRVGDPRPRHPSRPDVIPAEHPTRFGDAPRTRLKRPRTTLTAPGRSFGPVDRVSAVWDRPLPRRSPPLRPPRSPHPVTRRTGPDRRRGIVSTPTLRPPPRTYAEEGVGALLLQVLASPRVPPRGSPRRAATVGMSPKKNKGCGGVLLHLR